MWDVGKILTDGVVKDAVDYLMHVTLSVQILSIVEFKTHFLFFDIKN